MKGRKESGREDEEGVSNLVFYAQSTITLYSYIRAMKKEKVREENWGGGGGGGAVRGGEREEMVGQRLVQHLKKKDTLRRKM